MKCHGLIYACLKSGWQEQVQRMMFGIYRDIFIYAYVIYICAWSANI